MEDFDAVFRTYYDDVFRFLRGLSANESLAEELTQETFFQAIRSSDRFDGSCSVPTWLCGIAKKVHLTYLRKHPRQAELERAADNGELAPTVSAEDEAVASEERLRLLKRLHGLPEPYREVMYLRLFGDLSFRDIGTVQGRTENWARVTFYRGKEKLKKETDENE
jgi:RNA polymerase sigma-70 factor (ECF subfamily)